MLNELCEELPRAVWFMLSSLICLTFCPMSTSRLPRSWGAALSSGPSPTSHCMLLKADTCPAYVPQDELNELFEKLSLRAPEEAEAQARVILTGLGFTQQQQEGPIGQLSGALIAGL